MAATMPGMTFAAVAACAAAAGAEPEAASMAATMVSVLAIMARQWRTVPMAGAGLPVIVGS